MTNDPRYHHLRELSWRRQLTGAEEAELRAWLAAQPEAQAGWEAEAELNEALGRLADAPVSTNFTTRVLQAVELEAAAQAPANNPFPPPTNSAYHALVAPKSEEGETRSTGHASPPANSPASASSNSAAASFPEPPPTKPPVDFFRELLALDRAERSQRL